MKSRILEIGTCMRQILGVELKLKTVETNFQDKFEKMEAHIEQLNGNVATLEATFDINMLKVMKCEDDYQACLRHINETKEKVWKHIIDENEKQSNAILDIKNPIE